MSIALKTKIYDYGLVWLDKKMRLWTDHSLSKAHDYRRLPSALIGSGFILKSLQL